MAERTNEEWLAALRGSQRDEALADLRAILLRGLGYALADHGVREADLEDFVQEALLRILEGLDSFRGESRFTTWAQKIAVRVSFTELRRRRWRDRSLDAMVEEAAGAGFVPRLLTDPAVGPEQRAVQNSLLEMLGRMIREELTERQRLALVAVRIHGMPLEEVARRMGTNRNALYKLLHDARQRLKRRMIAEGMSPEELLAAFGPPKG